MKKRLIILTVTAIILSIISFSSVSGAENSFAVYCKKGFVFTDSFYYTASCGSDADTGLYTISENSQAVFLAKDRSAEINVSGPALIEITEEGFWVKEGVASVRTFSDGTTVYTGTETALISSGTKIALRVDDYGNTFNYCTKGTALLTARLDGGEYTLSDNGYIAVSVKKGIRIPDSVKQKDIEKYGIVYSDAFQSQLLTPQNGKSKIKEIVAGYNGENVFISEEKTNAVYKIKNGSGADISAVLYVESNINNAKLLAYNSEQELIQKSSNANGALMPNVHVTNSADGYVYLIITSDISDTLKLYSDPYSDIYSMSFETIKKMLPIAGAALAAFIIYELIRRKVSKRPVK